MRTRIPWWRKLLFSVVVTAAFFVGAELVLMLAGFEPEHYVDDPFVGFSSMSPLFVESASGTGMMETAQNKLRLFNEQRFLAEKPEGTTRIFCLGGSTTYGRPYDDQTSFCGWLRELLPLADPSREWELINAGGISYASYRVAVLMEELNRYEPDFYIIYSGHNEFLEARTYSRIINMPPAVRGLGSLMSRSRVHSIVKKVIDSPASKAKDESSAPLLHEEVTTLLDNAVGPSAYQRDDDQRDRVLEHFRYNLARMVDIGRSVGAATVLVTPASNLRDCLPFKSDHREDLSAAEMQRWQTHVSAVTTAIRNNDSSLAQTEMRAALAIDNRFAKLHFQDARVFEALQQFDEARNAYERARDEDVCPLRALGPIDNLVKEVAADREVMLADFAASVDRFSPNRLPGNTLFLDHVHPTVRGNLLIARTIVESMAAAGTVPLSLEWGDAKIGEIAKKVEAGIDSATHGLALMKLSKVLGWAGKLDESYRLALRATQLNPNDIRGQYQAGLSADLLGKVDASIEHYSRAIEIQPDADLPHGNLGVAYEKKGDLEAAIRHFRIAVSLGEGQDKQRNLENLANALHHFGAKESLDGRHELAIKFLLEARQIEPNNVDLLIRLGTAQFASGDAAAAVETFGAASRLVPENAGVHNRRAIALMLAGKKEEAFNAYHRALAIDPILNDTSVGLLAYLRGSGMIAEADELSGELLQ